MAEILSSYSLPVIILMSALGILLVKGVAIDEFAKGCRDGFNTTVRILPNLIILISAVNMFSASGAMEIICNMLGFFTEKIGIEKELIPIIITRPISGSSSNAFILKLFENTGVNSFSSLCASVIMGSSDTIIYTLSVYFGAVKITRSRYALALSFIIFYFCIIISVFICKVFF